MKIVISTWGPNGIEFHEVDALGFGGSSVIGVTIEDDDRTVTYDVESGLASYEVDGQSWPKMADRRDAVKA
jgi:hypothetical protein